MLRKNADSAVEIEVLSARSAWAAAAWIRAAPLIDLLISGANLSRKMGGIDVADLAAGSHPAIDVLLLSYHQKHTIKAIKIRYRFLLKPLGAEEIAQLIDAAYLPFLQTHVVNR